MQHRLYLDLFLFILAIIVYQFSLAAKSNGIAGMGTPGSSLVCSSQAAMDYLLRLPKAIK